VAVHVTDVLGVGGFVVPGERVDVLMTRRSGPEAETEIAATQVIAENIRVLGIDQADDEENSKATVVRTVTVEVTPAQAQLVTLAQNVGTVSFSLRHVNDALPLSQKATFLRGLGSESAPKPPPVKTPHVRVIPVTTIRVTRVTDTTVYQLNGR
jgi:pilus assembly protein CpaB